MRILSALSFLVSAGVLAQTPESLHCPEPTLKLDYVSPTSGLRRVFCSLRVEGELRPHGEELTFAAGGKLLTHKHFHHGQEIAAPAAEPEVDRAEIISVLRKLMRVVTRQRVNSADGFDVYACDKSSLAWAKLALTKQPQTFDYKFAQRCDVEGSFTATIAREFPMAFKVRNLDRYERTELQVVLNLSKGQKGTRARFKALQGGLFSSTEKIEFTAFYEVDINPTTGQPYLETQEGKINFLKLNDKVINHSEKLIY